METTDSHTEVDMSKLLSLSDKDNLQLDGNPERERMYNRFKRVWELRYGEKLDNVKEMPNLKQESYTLS